MASLLADAADCKTKMPWERGLRRAALIARRDAAAPVDMAYSAIVTRRNLNPAHVPATGPVIAFARAAVMARNQRAGAPA